MIGVALPTREALRTLRPGLVGEFAVRAEELGIDAVWAGDSLLARPLYDPFVTLATVAALTTEVRIGTGALLAPLRPAVPTAHAIATLDAFSGGRLILGVGRGFDLPETRKEFAAAEASFGDRSKRMLRTIETWRREWSEDGELQPKPAQAGGPPVWIAGYGPLAFRNVATHADGWLPYPPTPEEYVQGLARIRELAPDREIAAAMMITIAPDEASLAQYAMGFYGYPLELLSVVQACRHGDAAALAEVIGEYREAGAREFIVRLASIDRPLEALEWFGADVLPLISVDATIRASV